MAIMMTDHVLTWTDSDGTPRASGVGYDRPSAGHQKEKLENQGCTDVEVTQAKPGVLPESER
ncbi:hypothetical protein ABZY02_33020 [Streptomyces sp. NPDC006649]|uniref:hypothetical protein n=1 Tax=Streptomyces sp. NPDC006649 TaxID=3156896 RepID=UPI0033B784BB